MMHALSIGFQWMQLENMACISSIRYWQGKCTFKEPDKAVHTHTHKHLGLWQIIFRIRIYYNNLLHYCCATTEWWWPLSLKYLLGICKSEIPILMRAFPKDGGFFFPSFTKKWKLATPLSLSSTNLFEGIVFPFACLLRLKEDSVLALCNRKKTLPKYEVQSFNKKNAYLYAYHVKCVE